MNDDSSKDMMRLEQPKEPAPSATETTKEGEKNT